VHLDGTPQWHPQVLLDMNIAFTPPPAKPPPPKHLLVLAPTEAPKVALKAAPKHLQAQLMAAQKAPPPKPGQLIDLHFALAGLEAHPKKAPPPVPGHKQLTNTATALTATTVLGQPPFAKKPPPPLPFVLHDVQMYHALVHALLGPPPWPGHAKKAPAPMPPGSDSGSSLLSHTFVPSEFTDQSGSGSVNDSEHGSDDED